MKKYKADILWENQAKDKDNSQWIYDSEAIEDYVEAENEEEAREFAMDYLIEQGAKEEEIRDIKLIEK